VSVVVVTTISCDAAILRCESCQAEVAAAYALSDAACRTCGGTVLFDRRCGEGYSLHRDAILIRCIAENKDGWRCEDRGGRDFCPQHVHLADPRRVARPTQQATEDKSAS
jgi:DNA-directed RNA polymerase subunit RPC12/RpoP